MVPACQGRGRLLLIQEPDFGPDLVTPAVTAVPSTTRGGGGESEATTEATRGADASPASPNLEYLPLTLMDWMQPGSSLALFGRRPNIQERTASPPAPVVMGNISVRGSSGLTGRTGPSRSRGNNSNSNASSNVRKPHPAADPCPEVPDTVLEVPAAEVGRTSRSDGRNS